MLAPHRSKQHCRLFSCAKLFMGCGPTLYKQLIHLCSVDTGRSRQHCIGYFPAKTCLCALGQHCTSIFFVECCLRRVWTTLTLQNFYRMLSQHGQYNIVQVIFLIKVVCQLWANIAQVKALGIVVQKTPENIAQEKILFNVVLTRLRQLSTGKTFCNVVQDAPHKIAQKKSSSILS